MSDKKEKKAPKPKLYRIMPQIKTFNKGTLLKNKVDLYYTLEEDELVSEEAEGGHPLTNPGSPGNHNSFDQVTPFIAKESNLLFVEAAQFRANGSVYVRGQLIHGDKVVWTNIITVPNRVWAFMIRHEQKSLIKEQIREKFEILIDV